ncbi:DUF2341 domain-containing protein, partial [candidate division WWE3 bacterium]|nr:DUF2341 domain-containing protein [candidate division WWE3 bacterium]
MRKTKHLLQQKLTINTWQFNILVASILLLGLTVGSYFTLHILNITQAATSPWAQTDWSGGIASGTVTSTVTTYADSASVDTGTAISLIETSEWSASYLNWSRRKTVTLTNSGSAQTDYAVKLSITYDNDMQNDFDDLRFTNSSGTPLDYWVQSKTDTDSAIVWVEVDSLAGNDDTTIYMYYGNSGASNESNGENTFLLFDDFDDGTIDTSKWTEVDQSGSDEITETGGNLVFSRAANDAWDKTVYANNTFSRDDLSFEMNYTWVSNNPNYDALMMGWKDGTNGTSYTNLVYGYYNQGCNCSTTTDPQYVYEDGSSRGSKAPHTWNQGTYYSVRLRMKNAGGAYYEYSDDNGDTWTTAFNSSYSTETNLRPGWTFYNGTHHFDN